MNHPPGRTGIPSQFLLENFRPEDRLAIVIANHSSGAVIQRIASAERIAGTEFQNWLQHKNAERLEIYLSMNALHPSAETRTKGDVAIVRHLYLDFDNPGVRPLEALGRRADLPSPNYVVSTSPGKWQVLWKVEGFTPEAAERLQRVLAREMGADPAATDSARVLRLPGFNNHKYPDPHWVSLETISGEVYHRERFPNPPAEPLPPIANSASGRQRNPGEGLSQSERDWAFAKRALARGMPEAEVAATIASYRRFEKHNPQYYAELTVRKASQALAVERAGIQPEIPGR